MNKKWIIENCFTSNGNLNNRTYNPSWWNNKGFQSEYNKLLEITSYMDSESSISERLYHVYNNINRKPKCFTCQQKNTTFINFKSGYRRNCSIECSSVDPERIENIVKKLDHKEIQQKVKQTNLKKYGESSFFKTKEFKDTTKATKLSKYNNPNYCNHEKAKETCEKKYGAPYYLSSEKGKKHLQKKIIENNGSLKLDVETNKKLNDIHFLKDLNKTKSMTDIAEYLGVTLKAVSDKFVKHNVSPINHISKKQKLQQKLVDSIPFVTSVNDRSIITPKEIDIVTSKKIAIELNGVYWHSRKDNLWKTKHLEKHIECKNAGYQLLQFTDVEWIEKPDIVVSIIKAKMGIFKTKIRASKCNISFINSKVAKSFYESNHIQGFASAKHHYGLFYDNKLVFAMSLRKPRFNPEYEYEIVRMSSKLNSIVYGGMSKMMKHIEKTLNPKNLVSYANRDYSDGMSYSSTGFVQVKETEPGYFWCKNKTIISRYQAQKSKLKSILETFDPKKSEHENMISNGYKKYWNCGHILMLKKF